MLYFALVALEALWAINYWTIAIVILHLIEVFRRDTQLIQNVHNSASFGCSKYYYLFGDPVRLAWLCNYLVERSRYDTFRVQQSNAQCEVVIGPYQFLF